MNFYIPDIWCKNSSSSKPPNFLGSLKMVVIPSQFHPVPVCRSNEKAFCLPANSNGPISCNLTDPLPPRLSGVIPAACNLNSPPSSSPSPSRSDRNHAMKRSGDSNKAKRRKIAVACDDCRTRKVRCDGVQPGMSRETLPFPVSGM